MALEQDASLIVVPWRPRSDVRDLLFGGTVEEITASTDGPALLISTVTAEPTRVFVALDGDDLGPATRGDAELALALGSALGERTKLEVAVGPVGEGELAAAGLGMHLPTVPVGGDRAKWAEEMAQPGDVVVFTSRHSPVARLPRRILDECTVLVASARRAARWRAPDSSLAWGARTAGHPAPGARSSTAQVSS